MFAIQTVVENREKLYNICSCSDSLAGILWCVRGASARACGSVGTCQSLTGAFFVIGANLEGGFLMSSEEVKSKYKKSIAQFSLMDDTFMAVVFGNELQLSEMLLHTIMGNDKIRVITSTGQYAIKNLQGHSSTLDIFCQDELGR